MPFDYDKWFAETIGSGKLSEEDAKGLKTALAGDEVALKALENSFSRQSDYSRGMDELKTAQTELAEAQTRVQTEMDDARLYVKRNADNDHNNKDIYDNLVEENAQYRAKLVENDVEMPTKPIVTPETPEEKQYVTMDQLKDMADVRDRAYAEYNSTVMELGNKYHTDLGEYLDTRKLIQFAEDNNVNLQTAYTSMFKEEYAGLAEKSYQERLAADVLKAKEEMIAENPASPLLDDGPRRVHAIQEADAELATPDQRAAGAMKRLQEYRGGTKQIPEWTRD
jgi:hypothetical protein